MIQPFFYANNVQLIQLISSFWQYHAALSIAADHIISNGTCSQNGHHLLWGLWFIVPPCPPPKHEPDIWWVKLGQAHWHLPFLFYNLWDNNHWDTPQSRGKEWQKQCFFTGLHFKQKKLNWGIHMAWNTANIIKHHQTIYICWVKGSTSKQPSRLFHIF